MRTYRLVAPSRFEAVDTVAPAPGDLRPGEILLAFEAGGICGSDLGYFAGRRSELPADRLPGAARLPGFPMHEVAGRVLASASPDIVVGDRVVGWADGSAGLAETVRVSASGVASHPTDWTPDVAIMLQPVGCAIHALDQVGDLAGARVAVLGLGPIGLLIAHVARTRGASRVIGVDRVDRSECSSAFGVDEFVHSAVDRWAHLLADADRPDIVIEAIGHQVGTLADAVHAVAPHGLVYYFGIPDDAVYPLPLHAMLRKNLTLRAGSVTPPYRRTALRGAIRHLRDHPELAEHYVTDRFDFGDAERAYLRAATPRPGQVKVVITAPSSHQERSC